MHLHPVAAVEACASGHLDELGLVHGCLDNAVTRILASWEDLFPDANGIDACVLAGEIRQCTLASLELELKRDEWLQRPIRFNVKDFAGIHFVGWTDQRVRVLKRPGDPRTGKSAGVTEIPEDLFGGQYSSYDYEIAVLFEIDFDLKVLKKATLAACSGLDTARSATIYHEVELPSAHVLGATGSPARSATQSGADNGGFDEFFEQTEGYGPQPA